MGKKILEQDIPANIKKVHGNTIKYVSGFCGSHKKCKWVCEKGHEWEARYDAIMSGEKCPVCNINRQIVPLNEMIESIKIKTNNEIEYISGYTKIGANCLWRCRAKGHEWSTSPNHILHGTKCPICSCEKIHEKQKIPIEKIIVDVGTLFNNKIKYISGYIDSKTKCLWKCENNHFWEATPSTVKHSKNCPHCVKSFMEKLVIDFLDKHNVIYKHNRALKGSNYNGSIAPLRPDFLIETKQGLLFIELDGKQHFCPIYSEKELEEQQKRDRHKDKVIKELGGVLIRVTSSIKWGFKNHITIPFLLRILSKGISFSGEVDLSVFKPYDFNRD